MRLRLTVYISFYCRTNQAIRVSQLKSQIYLNLLPHLKLQTKSEHILHKHKSICIGNGFYYTVTNIFIVCHKHSKIKLGDICHGTVTWDASLIFSTNFYQSFASGKILPGKRSVAFIFTQLGGVLISGTSVYIAVSSLIGIASCAYLPLLSWGRYALSPPCFHR